ncbi:MAG: ATP-dependent helicase [Janthinobacterium lividum]
MTATLTPLNPAQRAAVTAPAPVLVLAGAGSGKTETLIRRVAHRIEQGEAADRLLCITFTAKAAGEVRARLAGLLGPGHMPRWVGTFHAITTRLLVEDGGIPGVPRGFGILGQSDARRALAEASGQRDMKALSRLAESVSLLKNGLVTQPRDLPRSAALARIEPAILAEAAALLPAYNAALARRQALDFDDLIAIPVRAMRADPALAARWSARWSEILVDEYQDTNHAQHALLRLLAGKPGRVFAVGDDLQAVYGWRGAEVAHIRRFGKDYAGAGAPLKLETNYRSTASILKAANAVARQDREALPKTLRPADPAAPAGDLVAIREANTPADEARATVAWVQALRRHDPALALRDCAILVRAGFVAEPILAALREAGLPTQLVQEREAEPAREVLAAIAWLRLAMSRPAAARGARRETWDSGADDAFRRACAFPARGIGAALFGRLRTHAAAQGCALAEAVASLEATAPERQALDAVLGIAREIGAGVRRRRLDAADALRLAAEATEIADGLSDAGGSPSDQAWAAALLAAGQAASVEVFCDAAALDEGLGARPNSGGDAVPVLTVHRAKGLEFDHVLLAGLEDGVWPHWQADEHGALAEERRLFYVGLTRARRSVRLSWVRHRRDWAGKPSRFLAEIPDAMLQNAAKPIPRGTPRAAPAPAPAPTQAETDRLVAEYRTRTSARRR